MATSIMSKTDKISLKDWLEMGEQDVLDIFASLPEAQKIGENNRQFVFVPGKREDKILLVAHADTCGRDLAQVKYKNGVYSSKNNDCLGADDRAGCAIVWNLRNSGHSLLIPNGEEVGCVGSRFLMDQPEWKKKINEEHGFAIEFDRMNKNDLVFYDVASPEFKKWCKEQFKGYKEAGGSFTDIRIICDTICGLNISVGYYDQHTGKEILVESEWHRTLSNTRRVISQEKLPRFKLEKPKYEPSYSSHRQSTYRMLPSSNYSYNNQPEPIEMPIKIGSFDWMKICDNCYAIMDESEYKANGEACIFCKEKF